MSSNNVISFPKVTGTVSENPTEAMSIKDASDMAESVHVAHALMTASNIGQYTAVLANAAGFSWFDNNEDNPLSVEEAKQFAFFSESIVALMLSEHEIYHPIQKIIEECLIYEPETNTFKFNNDIKIVNVNTNPNEEKE